MIGKRLRHLRKGRGQTLDQVAGAVGVSPSALSLIETGKREAKLSLLVALAEALGAEVADFLTATPPSRRAGLEIELERVQGSSEFVESGVVSVRTGARLPLDALESLVALHRVLAAVKAERDSTPEYARRANSELRSWMRASDKYFPEIERLADQLLIKIDHHGGPLTRFGVNALAEVMGYSLHSAVDLPRSTRTVTDLEHRRIFLPTTDAQSQRTLALAALGHIALDHRPPVDYAEFLRQRVQVNYFAAAALVPERWAVEFLHQAKARKDLEIDDLQERYSVSYEMAAHRFTNLATKHLEIPVHFMRVNQAGVIYKAYANDGVIFPMDPSGAVEGQTVCRYWTAREVFEAEDWTQPYQQYTDTPSGTYWCTAVAERGERENFSVSVGTPYRHVKWFRGRATPHRGRSSCPDPSLLLATAGATDHPMAGAQLAERKGPVEPAGFAPGRRFSRRR